jgi:hypothetical protein
MQKRCSYDKEEENTNGSIGDGVPSHCQFCPSEVGHHTYHGGISGEPT